MEPVVKRVVAVAFDQGLRQLEKEVLEMEGYRVVTAGDGRNALRILRQMTGQAIVLLDIMMPEITGVGVLERLNARPVWRARYAVILQSAQANLNRVAPSVNPDATLTLPFNVEQLLAAIDTAQAVLATRPRQPYINPYAYLRSI